jgi:hypothetical protein
VVRCSKCESPIRKIPAWLGDVKINFVCDSCKTKVAGHSAPRRTTPAGPAMKELEAELGPIAAVVGDIAKLLSDDVAAPEKVAVVEAAVVVEKAPEPAVVEAKIEAPEKKAAAPKTAEPQAKIESAPAKAAPKETAKAETAKKAITKAPPAKEAPKREATGNPLAKALAKVLGKDKQDTKAKKETAKKK